MSPHQTRDGATGFEIAIVGAAGRFPGARDLDEYWRLMVEGRETVRRFTREEMIAAGADPDVVERPNYVPVKPMLGDADLFDAAFFNYSPREAEIIDPQGRMLLELAWETLEMAGVDPQAYEGLIGVYAGGRLSTYMLQVYRNPEAMMRSGDFGIQIGGDKDYLATRISYKLDLGGPSVNVQTACSTGLVAVHLATQALLAGECDLALAGASSLQVPEVEGYTYNPGGVYSRRGQIRAFDAEADGTVFGNGVGMVALRRLDDALADRDRILAVIKGSAVSNDGSQRVGFTAPGVDGQSRVVRAAQVTAQVEADTLSYLEAHGTGTPIGDPIEIRALTEAFRETTDRKGFCVLSSVKSNIGHLSSAAGMAGLLKAVLALQHRQIPPSINFERPNPQIDFDASPFFIDTALRDWKVDGMPRRAGVSAFGIGGTNAHVIVEEAPGPAAVAPSHRERQLLVLSARTRSALESVTERLAEHLVGLPDEELPDAAHTLQRGRQPFEQRRIAVVRDRAEASAILAGENPAALLSGTAPGEERPVVFMFSGQGSQYPAMGGALYRTEPRFREEVDRCAGILEAHLGLDLREVLFPDGDLEEAARRLEETALTQPALFTVEHALATLWRSWGIEPVALIGHSIGEYVAACVAGVVSLPDALALVAARGRLMQEQPPGDMLSVPLSEEALSPRLGPEVSVAALNAPGRSVVSGPADAVAALRRSLEAEGVACRPLHTSHAFHSAMMESMLPAFVERFQGVELKAPDIPFVSNLTGTWITDEEATDPGYWARHLRNAVRFADGLATLAAGEDRIFLEVGPGKTLATLARQNPGVGKGSLVLSSMPHPQAQGADDAFALETLGRLWLAGVRVDWAGFHDYEELGKALLPTYPFERRSYWVDATEEGFGASRKRSKRADLGDWFHLEDWRPSVPPEPAADDEKSQEGRWVVFADPSGPSARVADALERRLAGSGRRSVRVEAGAAFEELGADRYRVGPEPDDYSRLLAAVAGEDQPVRRLVHLWGLGGGEAADAGDVVAGPAQERGFWSLLSLAKAVGKRAGDGPVRLAVAVTGTQRVAAEPVPHPERATVLGPAQVMPQENPRIAAAAFDLDLGDGTDEADELAAALVAEMDGGLPDPVVAYRDGERWVRGLAPVRLGPPAPERLRLREGGTYLITGGLGGFGRTFAEHLAREHRARLVLLGRTPLPERERWDEVVASGGRTADQVRAVRELEEMGAEVLVAAADVTDAESLKAALLRARERFGPLHGVIHAAGVPGGGMIQLKERAAAAAVLAPKLAGTYALESALAGEEPDFVLLCSSTIAILGGIGQVDYCAANNFLDAYARSRRRRGSTYTVSVNWGAWKDVGMAVETTLPSGAARAIGAAGGAGAGGVAEGALLEPFDGEPLHPLLDRRVEEVDGRTVFATRVSPETHWVLDEHRIQGRPAIPGTTYLEMVRAAIELMTAPGESAGPVEIRDLMFLSPILVPEGARREVRLGFEREGDGWSFRVTSAAGPEGPWSEHARGSAGRSAVAGPPPVDLEALRRRCDREVIEVAEGELASAEKLVYWGPRWQSLRRVHLGDGEGVVHLELPAQFASDLERLELHPALVDVATALGGGAVAEGSFLPLSYRRLRVHAPVPSSFDAHVQTRGAAGRETVTLDVTLLGPAGETLVEVEGFTMKRVGEPAQAVEALGTPAAGEAPRSLFGADGMSPAQGVEVLRRVLSHGRHPQIAASPRDLEVLLADARRRRGVELGAAEDGSGPARESHPRPELATPYVAPRNDVEETLAGVWAAALGVEEVGVHDNFFDLGGDSILGIQIITKAGNAGVALTPDLLFEHQTVAELAASIGAGEEAASPTAAWEDWLREQAAGPWADAPDHWLSVGEIGEEALAVPAAPASGAREELTVTLDAEATARLRSALPEARATLEEAGLAALAWAVSRRWGSDRMLVRLTGDGRAVAPASVGAAGAPAYHFPLLLDLAGRTAEPGGALLRAVKEQRRRVPGHGAPWPAWLHHGPDAETVDRLKALPAPRLALSVAEDQAAGGEPEEEAALELRLRHASGRLELDWRFRPAAVGRGDVEAMAADAAGLLERLGRETGGLDAVSTVDFPEADLDDEDLSVLFSRVGG